MNANLTLDQRVNRGIKKVKELYPGEELIVTYISFSRASEFMHIGIGSTADIDHIFIQLKKIGTSNYYYNIEESPIAGEFFSPDVVSLSPPLETGYLSNINWPLPYSLDSYFDKLFTLIKNRLESINICYDATINAEFYMDTHEYFFYAKLLDRDDGYSINIQTQSIHIPNNL